MLKVSLKDLYRNNIQKGGAEKNTNYKIVNLEFNDELKNNFTYFSVRYIGDVNNNDFSLENITDTFKYRNSNFKSYAILSNKQRNNLFNSLKDDFDIHEVKITNTKNEKNIYEEVLFGIKSSVKEDFIQNVIAENKFKIVYELILNNDNIIILFTDEIEDEQLELYKIKDFIKSPYSTNNSDNICKNQTYNIQINIDEMRNVIFGEAKLHFNKNWIFFKGTVDKNGDITYGDDCIKSLQELGNYKIYKEKKNE